MQLWKLIKVKGEEHNDLTQCSAKQSEPHKDLTWKRTLTKNRSFKTLVRSLNDAEGSCCLQSHSNWWNIDPKRVFFLSGRHEHTPHPLVEFEPGGETFAVLVLEPKEPGLPQSDGLHYLHTHTTQHTHLAEDKQTLPLRWAYLVKELFAGGAGQDGELQLSVHGCYANIYLPEKRLTLKLVTLGALSCVKEQRSMKATAVFEFVVGGNLVLWWQNDQKEDSLHVSVQPGASNHKRLVGTTIKTRSPHYSLNWVLYTNHKYSPLLSEMTAKLQLHAIECPTLLTFSCFLIRKHICFNIFSCLTWSPNAVISAILLCEVC